jgi:hypothetical protein
MPRPLYEFPAQRVIPFPPNEDVVDRDVTNLPHPWLGSDVFQMLKPFYCLRTGTKHNALSYKFTHQYTSI